MARKTKKSKNFKSKFKFDENNLDYEVKLRKKKCKWWWLLLLLLLLLLWFFTCKRCNSPVPPEYVDDEIVSVDTVTLRPCSTQTNSGDARGDLKIYDLGQNSGSFIFEFDTYSVPDNITIYDGKGKSYNVIFQYSGGSNMVLKRRINFHNQIITVEVTSDEDDTAWEYKVNCPD